MLSTTGQGRGIPEAIIGGQQAQISKEAAIQALPLQALLANAQGNVELAQSHLDTLFKIRFEDAKTKHEYKTKLLDSAMQVASKQEQRQYEAIQKADDRKYAEETKNTDQIKSISMALLTNQAPGTLVQKAVNAKTVAELMAIPGVGKYMQSPSERLDIAIKQQTLTDKRDAAKAAADAKKNGLLTEDQYKTATDLRKEYNGLTEVKNAKDSETTTTALVSSLSAKNPTSDIAAINSFQRLAVDPGVSVREGDVALLQSANSFGDKAWLRSNGYLKGDKLTDTARQNMQDLALKIHDARIGYATEQTAPIRTTAKGYGIDFDTYVGAPFAGSQAIIQKVSSQQQTPQQQATSYVDIITKQLQPSNPSIKFQGTPFQSIFN